MKEKTDTVFQYSDRLKVFVGTWNMYGRLLDIDLSTFLTKKEMLENTTTKTISLDGSATHPYHLLVIGTQECERDISESLFYPSKEIWEQKLSTYLGKHYRLLKTETLAALHVAVFVWLPVAYLVKDVQSESIKTGWANMIGNKGAVAVSVLFGSRSLLFINCHLRAHQTKLHERNANVERILTELNMPLFKKAKKRTYHSVIDQFDHVFLFGDTNYRIDAERPFVFDALRQGDYHALLEYDQLSVERRRTEEEGSPLRFFQEHPILFPPTYKLDTIHTKDTESTPQNRSSPSLASKTKSLKRRLSGKKKVASDTDLQQKEEQQKAESPSSSSSKVQLINSDTVLCYDSSEKQRVPSWTDRILWCDRAANHHVSPPPYTNNTPNKIRRSLMLSSFMTKKHYRRDTICYSYDAVLHSSLLGMSDHMPVIGVFGIWFDEWTPTIQQKLYKLKKTATTQTKEKKKKSRHWWQKLFR